MLLKKLVLLKKIISCFLLITIVLQVLPVKRVGAMLFNSQLNEELPHESDGGGADIKEKANFAKDYLPRYNSENLETSFLNFTAGFLIFSAQLPPNHTGEIATPPPDKS